MNSVIYNPLQEFESKYKALHEDHTNRFFEKLVAQSNVDVEQNRKTVKLYEEQEIERKKKKRKLSWLSILRVLMCITLVLIPIVLWKTTPAIKKLRNEMEKARLRSDELLAQAKDQMRPLNNLFTDRDALNLITSTLPLICFDDRLSVSQELDMKINYDFSNQDTNDRSTLDVLAGKYNENPFIFENELVHTMGTETYYGTKTIHWTETYRDEKGNLQTRTKSQTLQASVTKPKPFYKTQVVLHYCAQGAPDLSFSRDATNLHEKTEKQIERLVKRGEKKLDKKVERAVRENSQFVSMSNSDFEVLFDALDRTNEVQFRTLFTPLAQANIVDLILSKLGYGDDFNFIKSKRTNKIISNHSQGRPINLYPIDFQSHSFDLIKENFLHKNKEFFKALYFDFAPVWAIPIYQERPVHSLKPIPNTHQQYSLKECEALANIVEPSHLVHPATKTKVILKAAFVSSKDHADETCITAFSYDIEKRVDHVSVLGGDGHFHNVPVQWDEYIPLETTNRFFVSSDEKLENKSLIARRADLCIYKS